MTRTVFEAEKLLSNGTLDNKRNEIAKKNWRKNGIE
jgi:hypothetical protein